MKRLPALLLTSLISITFCSCIKVSGTVDLNIEPRVFLRFAEERSGDHPSVEAALEFIKMVERGSSGAVRVRVYDGGRLGDEKSVVEQLRFGGIDLAWVDLRAVEEILPSLALSSTYDKFFLIESMNSDFRGLYGNSDFRGPYGKQLDEEFEAAKLVALAWYDGGPDCLLLPPGRNASDLRGLRIGVDPSRYSFDVVSRSGGTPVPLKIGDFRRTAEADLVDGFRMPLIAAFSERLADLFSVTPIREIRTVEVLLASRISFLQLLPADRDVISRAAVASIGFHKLFRTSAEERAFSMLEPESER